MEPLHVPDDDPATTELSVIITGSDLITVSLFRPDAVDGEPGGPVYVLAERTEGNPMTPQAARLLAGALLAAADRAEGI